MDKDSVILKYSQESADDIEKELGELSDSNDDQETRLADIQNKIDQLYKKTGKTKLVAVPDIAEESKEDVATESIASYDELYQQAIWSLEERGLNVDDINYNALIEDCELEEVLEELNAPLPKDYRWKKPDFIVVFMAALVGSITDIILGSRDNALTGKGSAFSDKLNEIHTTKFAHASNAPIDFQGKIGDLSFGGGNHRELSRGHDLLRFVDGIKMFKNGTFEAVGYRDGVKYVVSQATNQYGNPYGEMTLIAAVLEYTHHMLADLCSNNSLPFPGYSFLRESNSRQLRKFSADMYKNGFNLKNVIIQSVSAISIEIIIRLYFSIMSVREYSDSIEIKEDYSNWEAIKHFAKPLNQDKLMEMLLVAHSITMAVNLGKVAITSIVNINITEIAAVVKYGIKVTKAVAKRNSYYQKLLYNSDEVNNRWEELGNNIIDIDATIIEEIEREEALVI